MKQKLDDYRREALRHLEREQADRVSRAHELRAEATRIDEESESAASVMLRAQEPMPGHTCCPRCWIWDGEGITLNHRTDAEDVEFFECLVCGLTVEAPIRDAVG